MKYYVSYMGRQEISPEVHEKLLQLEPAGRRHVRPWARYGALAACAALILGVGAWRMSYPPAPAHSGEQLNADTTLPTGQGMPELEDQDPSGPVQEQLALDSETKEAGSKSAADFHGFVVNSPAEDSKLMFPMIPSINYQDITDRPEAAASRAYAPGTFLVDLEKEDIQTIFWGPEGKPDAVHPKAEQGDLPWMLFWDGYTVHGRAWYDGQGQLTELAIYGEKGRASFELELRPGGLPFTCCIDLDRGDVISDVLGVSVAGWSKVYDRDGDGETDYICGSEFMTKNNIGVRFVDQNGTMRAEYGNEDSVTFRDMDLGGACTFNSLFVRQVLSSDGGLYLDHLMTTTDIPAWREEEFSTLAQARQEADFAPYLPAGEPEGYSAYTGNKEFYGRLSYQEGTRNSLWVRWSRGYDNVEVDISRDGYYPYHMADPSKPETYDLRLYPIPWCDSVPEEYRETVDDPAFRAEDMSLAIVEARGREHDTGGMTYSFDVLHPDGTLVSYHCDGMTAQQVWAMVEETL